MFLFSFFLFESAAAQEIDLNDLLILYLPMDGDALDFSGNHVHTILGGPSLTEDRFGQLNLLMRSDAARDVYKAQIEVVYDSQWHHYVARVDEQMHMEIYLDAELVADFDFGNNGSFVNAIDHVNLGTHHHTGGGVHGALNGMMDDVFIYNRALNLCEIEALYSGQLQIER